MRDRLPLLGFSLALLVAVITVLFVQASVRGDFAEPLSTYRSEPDGARALFLVAQRLGLPVERRHLNLENLEGQPELVLLGIEGDAPEDEEDAGLEANKWELERFSSYESNEVLRALERGATVLYAVSRVHPFLNELGVTFTPAPDRSSRELVPLSPSLLTRGVHTVQSKVSGYVDAPGALPLLIDPHYDNLPVAILIQRGEGRVVVLGAPELVSNRELNESDNAQLAIDLLTGLQPKAEPIVFDEFHHGFTGDRTVMGYAAKFGLHWAVLQILLALGLWTWSRRRLGPPEPLTGGELTASADYLLAMARIYQRGKHRGHVAQLLLGNLLRQLQALVKLPRSSSAESVVAALRAQGRDDLATGLEGVQVRAGVELTEPEVLSLSQAIARLREQFHP